MSKVYIAGPMTGYPLYNFEQFFAYAAAIRSVGDTPLNPAEHDVRKMLNGWVYSEADYDEIIEHDLKLIRKEADRMFMLRGWSFSKGAQMEHSLAVELGLDIQYEAKKHIYIVGHGRHGKDTVAEIMRDNYGFTFTASSWFMAGKVVFPALRNKYGYTSVAECFDDRHNHRAEWFDLIDKANPNGTELSEAIFKQNDIYVGIRSKRELDAVKADNRFDPLVVWVDASKRLEPEPSSSISIAIEDADYVVDNNGAIDDLVDEVNIFVDQLSL
tara:strand:+ start:718 stop:1530 length:813 start_codon:yes stop_codon:yes gene_type:complete